MKAAATLPSAVARLQAAGIEGAARDARLLLAYAMGINADRLTLHLQDDLAESALRAFDDALTARAARQPVSQITGWRLFWGLPFRVTRDTLDPRPETEILVTAALEQPFHKVLDLGTGTGCILLSCLKSMPMATGTGVDISEAALDVARENSTSLGLDRRARFLRSDWFSGVSGAFDLIVSNPPYIAATEMPGLAPEVRDWEPHLALSPGGDGLDAYRAIARGAGARLMPGGRLLVEIGPTQASAVAGMFLASGLDAVRVLPDLDRRPRMVSAVKPGRRDDCGTA